MDDDELYGKQLHVITFSEAVERGLLSDYKVIVLTIDEDHFSSRLQDLGNDTKPMQRAVVFCQVIEPTTGKSHKVSSKQISEMFLSVIDS